MNFLNQVIGGNEIIEKVEMMRIYADNAATTKLSDVAFKAMLPYMKSKYGNPSSIYNEGREAAKALNTARKNIATHLGCGINEIIFTSGGTESDNQAIISAAKHGAKENKKHIISSAFEHPAVLNTLETLKHQGFDITFLDVNTNGIIKPIQVEQAIREDTCLVTIMYANNEIGTIQPIGEIGKICREKDVIFHTDAVQAVGYLPIDVNKEKIDMLSLSAHKFHGPKGIGVLYAQNRILLHTIMSGGNQENGKRAGTENIPAIVGMSVALDECRKNMDYNTEKLTRMKKKLIDGLSTIPDCTVNGTLHRSLPGFINFSFKGVDSESLVLLLDDKGIAVSAGSACSSSSHLPSHVLLAIGRSPELAYSSLRISLCKYNTDEEVDYIIKNVTDAVNYLRSQAP